MKSLKEIYTLLNEENDKEKIEMMEIIFSKYIDQSFEEIKDILYKTLGRDFAYDLRQLNISYSRNDPELKKITNKYKNILIEDCSKVIDSLFSMQLKASGTVKK